MSRSSSFMVRPTKSEDWEPYHGEITALYSVMKLKEVMTEMQTRHNFKATEKQYKTMIKKWKLDYKYKKAPEYMAMIKTKRDRESLDPPKQTRFILRGREVDAKDIDRFEKRAIRKGTIAAEGLLCEQEHVDELCYESPEENDGSKVSNKRGALNRQYRCKVSMMPTAERETGWRMFNAAPSRTLAFNHGLGSG